MTIEQTRKVQEIRRRSSAIKGILYEHELQSAYAAGDLERGTIVVGYETAALSRDRNAEIALDGTTRYR